MSELVRESRARLAQLPLDHLKDLGITRSMETYALGCSRPTAEELSGERIPSMNDIVRESPDGFRGVLYAHVPVCERVCGFCGYHVERFSEAKGERLDRYFTAWKKEVESWKTTFGSFAPRAIYVGGGTPSALTGRQIASLLGVIGTNVHAPSIEEITFEVAPVSLQRETAQEKLSAMLEGGVTRVSIGVQSLDTRVLRTAGRRNTEPQVQQVYGRIKDAGFANVNIDLIYGLPGQTPEVWEQDLRFVSGLAPSSITTYCLRIEPGTPFARLYRESPELFPSEDDRLLMKAMAIGHLAEQSYVERPTDWFTRESGEHRAQVLKWHDGMSLLGTGVSAYSALDSGWLFGNIGSRTARTEMPSQPSPVLTDAYTDAVLRGTSPLARGHKLTPVQHRAAFLSRALKTGVNTNGFENRFGISIHEAFPAITGAEELGLVHIESGELKLTFAGSLLAEETAAHLTLSQTPRNL